MGVFRNFPYSNFHEMNMDELIKIFLDMQDEWNETKEEWATYKDYIDNYFNTLDLSEETYNAILRMIENGVFHETVDPVIITETEEWLTEHITQPVGVVIDNSLTVAGACADAKVTGDRITYLSRYKVNQPIDNNNQPVNGTNGQILCTNGDGSTKWSDVGLPSDEQTAQAVNDWLDAHPEATTTVVDGSLTEAKFSTSLINKTIKDYVTPEMFGAVGDGITDDTIAVQDAIDTGKSVLLGCDKTYLVNTIYIKRNTQIYGQGKTTKISSNGNVFELDPLATYVQDVILSNFVIEGDNGLYFNNTVYDCYSIKIENITFVCTDTCIFVVKGFQWYVNNIWLTGNKGIVGINGPACTFMNIHEANCQYMFVNCNGLFISINASNSGTTDAVFDYTDSLYGHSLIIINSNFENVRGKIIQNLTTNGFNSIIILGLNILNFNTTDYLLDIALVKHLYIQIRNIDPINNLTKFINLKSGITTLKSFYINETVPFAVNGADIPIPSQTIEYNTSWRYPLTKFSGIETNLVKGNLTPIQEDVALKYTIQISTGTFVNITPGTGQDLAQVRPFQNAFSAQYYMGIGSIITIRNNSGISINLGTITNDYTFETTGTMADGTTKSFILQHNGTRLVWHEI